VRKTVMPSASRSTPLRVGGCLCLFRGSVVYGRVVQAQKGFKVPPPYQHGNKPNAECQRKCIFISHYQHDPTLQKIKNTFKVVYRYTSKKFSPKLSISG